MELIIGSDIRVKNPSKGVIRWAEKSLVFPNPQYYKAVALGKYSRNIEKSVCLFAVDGGDLIVPFGCLSGLWREASKERFSYSLSFPEEKKCGIRGDIGLYDYQKKAMEAMITGKNGVLQAPCGSGKTQIGLALIKSLGKKALWLTHTRKLLLQSMERCKRYYEGDFGTITDGKVRIGGDITFATVQTMSEIDPEIYRNAFSVVVVDECHHCVGTPSNVRQFYKVLRNCNCRNKFGMSATIERKDGLTPCVFSLLGEKLYEITEEEVGSKIVKASHIGIEIAHRYDVSEYSGYDGMVDYNKMIAAICGCDERNRKIAEKAEEARAEGRKQIILTARVEHARILSEMIPGSSLCVGKIPEGKRDYSSDVIVATYALAKEGLDIPELDTLHLATPSKDRTTVKQSAGRVERSCAGKKNPVIYDYVDVGIPYCKRAFNIRKNILKK